MNAILQRPHMQALNHTFHAVTECGRNMNQIVGRGLVLFLFDPEALEFETGYLVRADINERYLSEQGFPHEAVTTLCQAADTYALGDEFVCVAASRRGGNVEEFSTVVGKLDQGEHRLWPSETFH